MKKNNNNFSKIKLKKKRKNNLFSLDLLKLKIKNNLRQELNLIK